MKFPPDRYPKRFASGADYTRIAPWWKFWADPKYRLLRDACFQTPIHVDRILEAAGGSVRLVPDEAGSLLWCLAGYEWDGPSGPTYDTDSTMRGSCGHDGGYDLCKEGQLTLEARKPLDILLWRVITEDGTGEWRAAQWLWAVRRFAARAARG